MTFFISTLSNGNVTAASYKKWTDVASLYLTASGVEANYYRSYQNEIIVKVIFKSINAIFYNILTPVLDP